MRKKKKSKLKTAIISVYCINCGLKIQVDSTKEEGVCYNCKEAFITGKIVEHTKWNATPGLTAALIISCIAAGFIIMSFFMLILPLASISFSIIGLFLCAISLPLAIVNRRSHITMAPTTIILSSILTCASIAILIVSIVNI